jgi:hypothetical protein
MWIAVTPSDEVFCSQKRYRKKTVSKKVNSFHDSSVVNMFVLPGERCKLLEKLLGGRLPERKLGSITYMCGKIAENCFKINTECLPTCCTLY